jgi:hypothetical protein
VYYSTSLKDGFGSSPKKSFACATYSAAASSLGLPFSAFQLFHFSYASFPDKGPGFLVLQSPFSAY